VNPPYGGDAPDGTPKGAPETKVMLLAGFVALVVILTAVAVNLSGRLKFIRFNVEFEGRKALRASEESSDERKSLPECTERKQIS
jgi:hypothetical protein